MADSLDALHLERLRGLRGLRLRACTIAAGAARDYDDPAGFIRGCIQWRGPRLFGYQGRALTMLPARRDRVRTVPHEPGKTTSAGGTIPWFALTREAARKD